MSTTPTTVKLRNVTRQMQVFNLETPFFVNQQGENGVGKPESVTFLPLETKTLPVQALQCAQIKNAIRPPINYKGKAILRALP